MEAGRLASVPESLSILEAARKITRHISRSCANFAARDPRLPADVCCGRIGPPPASSSSMLPKIGWAVLRIAPPLSLMGQDAHCVSALIFVLARISAPKEALELNKNCCTCKDALEADILILLPFLSYKMHI
jgi:hypothetical protein